jgi:uncharacterized protein YodC (DUF2158 family)
MNPSYDDYMQHGAMPWGEHPYMTGIVATLTDDTFEIGDIVRLIVGGPDMVVISVCECGTVEIAWVDSDGDVNIDVLPEEALVFSSVDSSDPVDVEPLVVKLEIDASQFRDGMTALAEEVAAATEAACSRLSRPYRYA